LKLHNTLTRQIEELQPQKPPHVTIYTCGPTVYDYPHIGNWFTFIRYDILIRSLKITGFEPKWIMNITDVGHLVSDADEGEDKLEKGAKREGKTAWEVAEFYTDYFLKGMKRLNITDPDGLPKATDHIKEQVELIEKLEKKGFTYAITDGVYFDSSKLDDYGKLAQLNLEKLKAGARVEVNPEKRNPTDFALWKFSPKDHVRDMEWESPWGKGFPGWHIECSAMSMKYLSETLDIHGGGIDHIPVHHTNEIAQSEAATGKPFSKYWFHANHILVNDKKIAKSAGNSITLEDIEKKGFSLMALRLLVLESHYRTQSTFSWETLEAAQNRLKNWQSFADLRWQTSSGQIRNTAIKQIDWQQPQILIKQELANDLNTPLAITWLDRLADDITMVPQSTHKHFNDLLQFIDTVFGLQLSDRQDITESQKVILVERKKARENKDWKKSDELRLELEKHGIAVKDTEHGPIWSRI